MHQMTGLSAPVNNTRMVFELHLIITCISHFAKIPGTRSGERAQDRWCCAEPRWRGWVCGSVFDGALCFETRSGGSGVELMSEMTWLACDL